MFRPVGLLSSAAGLLLSIFYYAIPVEPPRTAPQKRTRWGTRLRRQFGLERVALIGYSANLLFLQEPLDHILHERSSFQGMDVWTHYEF